MPLAVLVGFLDLVPLIGFTVGGLLVAVAAGLHGFPGTLLIWLGLFVLYQQVQDRVVQPIFYKNAVQLPPGDGGDRGARRRPARRHPRRAAGDPGRGLAGVIFEELWPAPDDDQAGGAESAAGAPESPDPGVSSAPATP